MFSLSNIRALLFRGGFGNVLRNTSTLLSGTVISAALGFVSTVVTARAIGPEALGVLTLAHTVMLLIAAVLLPKPWMSVIRYGARLLEAGQKATLKTLLLLTLAVEVGAAVVAALVGIEMAGLIASLLNAGAAYDGYFSFYAGLLFLNVGGVPVGVLRLYDRFDLLRNTKIVAALLRVLLAVGGWWAGQGPFFFLCVLMVFNGTDYVLKMIFAAWVARQEGYFREGRASLRRVRERTTGFLRFSVQMHVNDMLGVGRRQLDFFVLGALMPTSGVGFYKVMKQFGRVLTLLANPLKEVLYPECCKFWERRAYGKYRSVLVKACVALLVLFAPMALLIALFGEEIVSLLFGPLYRPAGAPLAIYFTSIALLVAFQSSNVALLSMGRGGSVVGIEVVTNVVYFTLIAWLVPAMGLWGVVWSFAGSILAWLVFSNGLAVWHFRRRTLTTAEL